VNNCQSGRSVSLHASCCNAYMHRYHTHTGSSGSEFRRAYSHSQLDRSCITAGTLIRLSSLRLAPEGATRATRSTRPPPTGEVFPVINAIGRLKGERLRLFSAASGGIWNARQESSNEGCLGLKFLFFYHDSYRDTSKV